MIVAALVPRPRTAYEKGRADVLPPADAFERVWRPRIDEAIRLARSRAPWLAAGFLLLSLPIGAFWFVVLVTLLAVGVAVAVVRTAIVVALWAVPVLVSALLRRRLVRPPLGRRSFVRPILAIGLLAWVLGARGERRRVAAFTGEVIPPPYAPRPTGSAIRRARALARDRAVWRDLAYLLLLLPIGVVAFPLAVVAVVVPVALAAIPAYYWMVPGGVDVGTVAVDTLSEAILVAPVGLALGVAAAWVLVMAARGHVALARELLGPSRRAALALRVDELTRSRSSATAAQLAERQRIERDLHDGAQQRLVALAMDLGLAREKFGSDPEAARTLVESSHEEVKRVLVELRDLVRGIHPAVLSDRGLDAAISAIAGRSPVPVRVDVRLEERLPEPVEAAAYFLVVEALTNVAKHANATEARVLGRCVDGTLIVEVADDGVGGADPLGGTGLAGLRDRLAALDGRLTVESPMGGPTIVRAEIPVA